MADENYTPIHPGDARHTVVTNVVHAMMRAVPRGTDNGTLVTALLTAFCEAARLVGMSSDECERVVAANFAFNGKDN